MTTLLFFFLITFALFSLELLLPGGILGILGIFLFFYSGWWVNQEMGSIAAVYFLSGSVVVHFIGIYLELQLLKKFGFGNKWLLKNKVEGHVNNSIRGDSALKGKLGIAETNLNPIGIIQVEDHSYEAYSKDGFIEQGERIIIQESNRFKITVHKQK